MKPSDWVIEPQRLHPMTIVQRVIVSLPALAFILLPVIRGGDSAAMFNLVFAAMYFVVIVPFIALNYLRFRYWITDSELVIHSGVITRRRRNIPIERVQNIVIEQPLLPRLMGTAKVMVYTAGSSSAEGVLEYVSLRDAQSIRSVVRQMQQDLADDTSSQVAAGLAVDDPDSVAPLQESDGKSSAGTPLFSMDVRRVTLAGAYQISLFYIAAFFSLLQYYEPDPEVYFDWVMRGPLEPWSEAIQASPVTAIALALVSAMFLGWISSILLTLNRWHRFRIELVGDKLHRAHGLTTLKEGTIPLRRIQAYIIRSNPLMKRFGWFRLELQTMGKDVSQSGFEVAVPFGRMEEVRDVLRAIGVDDLPEAWHAVSPLTIRRFMARAVVLLGVIIGVVQIWWTPVWWGALLLLPAFLYSLRRYANMGWSMDHDMLGVRRGVFRKHTWYLPINKLQTASRNATLFQRRLGLANVYVDTAGASDVTAAEVIDMPQDAAVEVMEQVYGLFTRRSA